MNASPVPYNLLRLVTPILTPLEFTPDCRCHFLAPSRARAQLRNGVISWGKPQNSGLFLVARPLKKGGGGKGLATKEKVSFFEAL